MEDNYQRKNANMQTGNLRLSDSNHTKTPGMNSSAAIVLFLPLFFAYLLS
jgi:hypothetical protein